MRTRIIACCIASAAILAAWTSKVGFAQEPDLPAAAIEQSSLQPVPTLVRSQGTLPQHSSERVLLRFSIYATEASRQPLWSEQQLLQLGPKGEYTVSLGAGSTAGLPQTLFVAGEPRWLAVQYGDREESRTLLTSVPYAFKSLDSESLAGRSAAEYVTRDELKSVVAAEIPSTPMPQVSGTLTGSGTTNTIPLWTGAAVLGNSVLTQSGTKIGVGIAAPVSTLDVNGTINARGAMTMLGKGAAAAGGANSPSLQLGASSFSSATSAAVPQTFAWQAQPTGNNTATPSARLALLFGSGTTTPAATGLSVAPNGVITFASGQTFPSTANSFPKGATFGAESYINGSSTDWMLVATNTSSSSKGTILGQASGSGIGVEGASPGGVGLDGLTDTGYAVYGIANTSGTAVYGGAYGSGPAGKFWSQNASGPAVVVTNVAGGTGISTTSNMGIAFSAISTSQPAVFATSTTGAALNAVATTGYAGNFSNVATYNATVNATNGGAGNAGVFNNNSASRVALAGVNASTDPNAIATYGSVSNGKAVYGIATTSGIGVYGTTPGGSGSSAVAGIASGGGNGVFGSSATGMGVYAATSGNGVPALYANGGSNGQGVDAESVSETAVIGHSTNSYGGFFETDNSNGFALFALNNGSGSSHTFFSVFKAMGASGTCGMGSAGDLSCTGQVKSIVTTGKARQVETYAMQSPENWLEDFGSGELKDGVAVVTIDPAFADTVTNSADYHVFLTPNGDSKGLYVTRKTATSFEVRESGGGTSSLPFDFRVVAKRRGFEAQRLTDVTEQFQRENTRTPEHLKAAGTQNIAPNR